MRVKCLAQEHNVMPRRGLEPGPFNPESSALTIRPARLPHNKRRGVFWQLSFEISTEISAVL